MHVLGLTSRTTLSHACDILTDAEPSMYEEAAIDLAELTSQSPQSMLRASEFIGDTRRIASKDLQDFIHRSIELGFVDDEGEGGDGLLLSTEIFSSAIP